MKPLVLYGVLVLAAALAHGDVLYTSKWAVRMDDGGENGTTAQEAARQAGFRYLRPLSPGFHLLLHPDVPQAAPHPSPQHQDALRSHPRVAWAQQLEARPRSKRDLAFNDPYWKFSWHLHGRGSRLDMRVMAAWKLGYSGRGVVVTVVDDGLSIDHPDLRENYDPAASYDVCDDDPVPTPPNQHSAHHRFSHGTRCAGEIAAVANNRVCSLGVAFRARIGGVRLLSCSVTDDTEHQALSLNPDYIDIYSVSWGPQDDGKTVNGPGTLALEALARGVRHGRHGKGSIYVWASGNGGAHDDACGLDGYVNSPFTLTVSAALRNGMVPNFSERCAATLVTALSAEYMDSDGIATTSENGECTRYHSGTSASAPLVAGIVALALEANPELTWRDVQHLVVETAKPDGLHGPWSSNGAGKPIHDHFGFGLIDAEAMVTRAMTWSTVPEMHLCEITGGADIMEAPFMHHSFARLVTEACREEQSEVSYVEYVQVTLSLTTEQRGATLLQLISPSGTRSTLMPYRPKDHSGSGLQNWTLTSSHFWGEDPRGRWVLAMETSTHPASLHSWSLQVTGTSTPPVTEAPGRQQPKPLSPCSDCVSKSRLPGGRIGQVLISNSAPLPPPLPVSSTILLSAAAALLCRWWATR